MLCFVVLSFVFELALTHYSPKEYDFIVVGAGSAGSTLAGRLSEVQEWSVLLIEAGDEPSEMTKVPFLAGALQKTQYAWKMYAEASDTSCLAMTNQRCFWPRGKGLGGSSLINFMLYIRGNKKDYDHWESLGNNGWGYDDVLPYFLKSEDNGNKAYANSKYHNTGGPLHVQSVFTDLSLSHYLMKAGKEFGYNVTDCNGEFQTGFMIAEETRKKGQRWSAADAFLTKAKGRENLSILTNAIVQKVLITDDERRAYGVEFKLGNDIWTAKCRKEIILSAGSIHSPQILMLSGVGPKEHLSKYYIDIKHDLEGVGRNLQDHVGSSLIFEINAPLSLNFQNIINSPVSFLDWLQNETGPLRFVSAAATVGYVHTLFSDPKDDWPDIQFLMVPNSVDSNPLFSMEEKLWEDMYSELFDKNTFMLIPNVMRPKSRGFIELKSPNPGDHPRIVSNYFSNFEDVQVLIEGMKLAYKYSQTKTLQKLNATMWRKKVFPKCEKLEVFSDSFWECYIRHLTVTIYHIVGTCKMGPEHDSEAVVNSRLKVYGIERLRVIDASVMPNIVSGNTNAAVIMIGEKGADMIKEDWQQSLLNSCQQEIKN